MFAVISCPKCGHNPRFLFDDSSSLKNFTSCEHCGGFAFVVGHHNIEKRDRPVENGCTPDIVSCLSYENLTDTVAYLNEDLSFRNNINLLAAAYSHYRYGKSKAYKFILENGHSYFYNFNMSLLPIFSVYKDMYFMNKEDLDILFSKTDVVCYSLVHFLSGDFDFKYSSTTKSNIFYLYLCYLTLLKMMDGITESISSDVINFLIHTLKIEPYEHGHLFAKRIGVYSPEWPEIMASLLYEPDKPSNLTTNNTIEIYQ